VSSIIDAVLRPADPAQLQLVVQTSLPSLTILRTLKPNRNYRDEFGNLKRMPQFSKRLLSQILDCSLLNFYLVRLDRGSQVWQI
jgi:hypothetical protein